MIDTASAGDSRRRERSVVVGGVRVTNPDRVFYPEVDVTKLDLARYYASVAQRMLPYVARRPLTLVRCPEGSTGACFFQKHAGDGLPAPVLRVPIDEEEGTGIYMAIESTAGLLSLVQMDVLEFHVWGSRIETLERPDRLVFDLDPDPALPFARASAEAIARASPDRFTASASFTKRTGKIYIDYLRNARGATHVATFSTRRHPRAPVSMPLRWNELRPQLRADRYTVQNVRRRLAALNSDPWQDFDLACQAITDAMLPAPFRSA